MAWTYSGNPANSTLDEVRFLIGDTITTRQQLQDAEINYALSTEGNTLMAAARCCDALAAQLSSQADRRVGDMSLSASQRAKAYTAKARDLRNRGSRLAMPFCGGISVATKAANEQNTDVVQPSFFRDQMDNPVGATETPGGSLTGPA